jgi:DMSO/TMAO reductase YedYZ molybdopterin-dependent catalytic subunit
VVRPPRSAPRLTGLLRRPLPAPPQWLRRGPLRRRAFTSRVRSPRLTSQLGLMLGTAITICFVTGLLSHLIQHPPSWFWWPSRPVGLYRVTQGVHVATGFASVGLLSAKLWSVYPKLFTWPPVRDLVHALERISVFALVSAVLFQLVTGILNVAGWYSAMPFAFIASHYWTAWLAIGGLLLHVAVKLPIVRGALRHQPRSEPAPRTGLTRRGLLAAAGAAVGVVTLATVGQTIRPLQTVSALAPRRPDTGPQGLPVNNTAFESGVHVVAADPDYRLTLAGPSGTLSLSLPELAALPQTTVELPIACVEGWSATAHWTGVLVRDLIARVGGQPGRDHVVVESMQRNSAYAASTVDASHTADPLSLIALRLNGETLHIDHGYPCRLIAPNRPGAMQTKWLQGLTVVPG